MNKIKKLILGVVAIVTLNGCNAHYAAPLVTGVVVGSVVASSYNYPRYYSSPYYYYGGRYLYGGYYRNGIYHYNGRRYSNGHYYNKGYGQPYYGYTRGHYNNNVRYTRNRPNVQYTRTTRTRSTHRSRNNYRR